MTPEELDLIIRSSRGVTDQPDEFSADFYSAVFDIAPGARSLFPDDMTAQRDKLVRELQFMVNAATAWADPQAIETFVHRTRELGRRHVGYGVTVAMYEPVGTALIATLRDRVSDFDDATESAWTKLFALVSETMLEGANQGSTRPSAKTPA